MTAAQIADGVWAFEDIDASLPLVPVAARRALDRAGIHLSLAGWLAMPLGTREQLVREGTAAQVDVNAVLHCCEGSGSTPVEARDDTELEAPPNEVLKRNEVRARDAWIGLTHVERYAVLLAARSAKKRNEPARLMRVLAVLMPGLA